MLTNTFLFFPSPLAIRKLTLDNLVFLPQYRLHTSKRTTANLQQYHIKTNLTWQLSTLMCNKCNNMYPLIYPLTSRDPNGSLAKNSQQLILVMRMMLIRIITGWWHTYPSEKYEFVSWGYDIPN
jgi:hypothetical protein